MKKKTAKSKAKTSTRQKAKGCSSSQRSPTIGDWADIFAAAAAECQRQHSGHPLMWSLARILEAMRVEVVELENVKDQATAPRMTL